MESDHLVSQKVIQKIDKATCLMMENGFYHFYMSMASFTQKLIERAYLVQEENEFYPLAINQMRRPMLLLFSLWSFTTIIFCVEIIVFKWKNCTRVDIIRTPHVNNIVPNLFQPFRTISNVLMKQQDPQNTEKV